MLLMHGNPPPMDVPSHCLYLPISNEATRRSNNADLFIQMKLGGTLFRTLVAAMILLVCRPAIAGPIFPTRGLLIAPKWRGVCDTSTTLDAVGFWSTINRGFNSDQDRFGWAVITGAMVEIARWNGTSSLFALGGVELDADTRNDISFNPRGAFWEEGVMFAHQGTKYDWQLGAIYRCRHDVDNGDPRETIGAFEQRTLIYGSLSARIIGHPTDLFGTRSQTTGWLRGEAYLFREDDRIPLADEGTGRTDFRNIAWTLGGGIKTHVLNLGQNFLYAEGEVNFSCFGKRSGFFERFQRVGTIAEDLYGEIGYETEGNAGRLQLFVSGTSFNDDGSTPAPRDSKFIGVGMHLSGIEFVR